MSAILKTYIHKEGSARTLENYLRKNGRSIAFDYCPELRNPENWSAEFDADRKALNKDKGRKVYHFIISPDPREHTDLDSLRNLATEWADTNFPLAKWAIHYHKDNAGSILHAHIAVNAVQMDGKKIQIGRKQYNDIRLSTHELAEENGMTMNAPLSERDIAQAYHDRDDLGKTWEDNININRLRVKKEFCKPKTAAEKRIEARGQKTWKQEIRETIDKNKVIARTWDEFCDLMEKDGITVKETYNRRIHRRACTFIIKEPVYNKLTKKYFTFAVKDANLSTDVYHPDKYMRHMISRDFAPVFNNPAPKPAPKSQPEVKQTIITVKRFRFRLSESSKPTIKNMPEAIAQPSLWTFNAKNGVLPRVVREHHVYNAKVTAQALNIVRQSQDVNLNELKEQIEREQQLENAAQEKADNSSRCIEAYDKYKDMTENSYRYNWWEIEAHEEKIEKAGGKTIKSTKRWRSKESQLKKIDKLQQPYKQEKQQHITEATEHRNKKKELKREYNNINNARNIVRAAQNCTNDWSKSQVAKPKPLPLTPPPERQAIDYARYKLRMQRRAQQKQLQLQQQQKQAEQRRLQEQQRKQEQANNRQQHRRHSRGR